MAQNDSFVRSNRRVAVFLVVVASIFIYLDTGGCHV